MPVVVSVNEYAMEHENYGLAITYSDRNTLLLYRVAIATYALKFVFAGTRQEANGGFSSH